MITFDSFVRNTFRAILSFCILVSLIATPASASPSLCSEAPPIGLDETLRGESLSVEAPECFRLETPATGLLMLDLAVPGTATAEPRLGLLGARSARVDVIEQSASHLLISTDAAQELTVCVGAQDPRHELGEYRLSTAFVELDRHNHPKTEQIEVDPDPFSGCHQKTEQIEVDPDPFSGCHQKTEQIEVDPDPFSGCHQKTEQIEVDPDPFSGCHQKTEQIEVDPDPFSGLNPIETLCRAQRRDDHSDSWLCATRIEPGCDVHGEIDNDWGDDHDVFVFELSTAQTVRLETVGDLNSVGGLYDRHGQRLAVAADGGSDDNFSMVKTLQPGVYFVRIEGTAWSRGAYALTVDTLETSW